MSAVGIPERFSKIRKYMRLLAFVIISPIWTFHWRSDERFKPEIFACFTTLSRLPFTVRDSKTCLECFKSMMSSLHFLAFSWSLFSMDHFSTDVTTCWTRGGFASGKPYFRMKSLYNLFAAVHASLFFVGYACANV